MCPTCFSDVIVFTQLNDILSQKIISVFSVVQSKRLYYTITESVGVTELQRLISQVWNVDSQISPTIR